MIKYVAAGDALTLGLFLLVSGCRNGDCWATIWRRCAPLTLAFALPFLAVYAWYAHIGQLDAFFFYTFQVTGSYPVEIVWWRRLLFMGDFFLRYLPITVLALLALREYRAEDRPLQYFCLLWLLVNTVLVVLPGKTFGHYQIQLMSAFALLAATWFHPARVQPPLLRRKWRMSSMVIVGLLTLGISVGISSYYLRKADYPRQVAQELQQRMQPGDLVYVGNYHHIIYYLLRQPSPTPYVHSSLLFYHHHVRALDIDLDAESNRLLQQEQLRFILLRKKHEDNILTRRIKDRYTVIDTLAGDVLLYERR